ncbi:MAG: plasmid mobilization protein [Cognatishimia sp.]
MNGQKKSNCDRTAISPVTLRLTPDEREKLEELAAGMTLSAYIRACVFGKEARRRKHRPKDVIADKKAAAEALALLGQSRIASNLNQLAYHANIGTLAMDESAKHQIAEAYAQVLSIRSLLMQALGKQA